MAERVVLGARLRLIDRIVRLRVAEIDRQRPGDPTQPTTRSSRSSPRRELAATQLLTK